MFRKKGRLSKKISLYKKRLVHIILGQMKNGILKKALGATSPVFFGYIALGIAFGMVTVHSGYDWWLAPLTGIIMYTGTGQFFGIALFASGARLSEILLAEFLLSIRHIFYGLSLIGKYKDAGKFKFYLMYANSDETFALITGSTPPLDSNPFLYYTLLAAFDQFYWLLGSALGAVAYSILQHHNLSQYLQGVDFALTALFVVLVIEQLKKKENILPSLVGGGVSLVTVILYMLGLFSSSNIIWLSICLGLAIMFLIKGSAFYKEAKFAEGGTK